MKNLTLLFLLCFALPAMAQYQVGHSSFSFLDASRNNLDVYGEVYYPATTAGDDVPVADGEFPVIVFGHGFGVAWSEYDIWWNELVPCGYIMVFPETQGGGIFSPPSHSEFGKDLSFLVDAYLAENDNSTSDFFQHISGKSAVMGHSMGGGCTLLAAEQNANINTIITLAAAGNTDPSSIDAALNVTIPSLTIAGSDDCVVPTQDHQIPIYNNLASVYKGYLEIGGASHCNFSKNSGGSFCSNGELFCSAGISKAVQHTRMFAASKPWLDYYLKEDCQGWIDFEDYATTNNGTLHTYLDAGEEEGCRACANILTLDDAGIPSGIYQAGEVVYSAGQLVAGADVDYIARDSVVLKDGFCVPLTTDFEVMIDSCQ